MKLMACLRCRVELDQREIFDWMQFKHWFGYCQYCPVPYLPENFTYRTITFPYYRRVFMTAELTRGGRQ